MKTIILLLGSPNDDEGNLSQTALDRTNCALELYKHNDNIYFLCTGGFGEQFNRTDTPHAFYLREYLINGGVKDSDFVESAMSSNTVDDFRKSKPIIEKEKPDLLILITSDFHMERAKILFNLIITFNRVIFITAKSSLDKYELTVLQQHEKKVLQQLKDNNYALY